MKALRWITLKADLGPVTLELRRIADALERISPPPGPDQPVPENEAVTYASDDAALLQELLEAEGRTAELHEQDAREEA